MRVENLLVEIGTEELPPNALSELASAFATNLEGELRNENLAFDTAKWFATPRRLAVMVSQLAEQQQDKIVEKRGPAVSVAFDADGNPTKAAQGWARGNGISVAQADRLTTDKGEWLLHKAEIKGENINSLIPAMVERSLKKLPIPKPMRWGANTIQFIRPVHSLTLLFGNDLLSGNVLGLSSTRLVFGHRFHGEKSFELDHADNYVVALEAHNVLVDFDERKSRILIALNNAAVAESAKADIDDDLLDEVTSLVEWPVVYTASFDDKFLDVPKEALIYTMKDDQKYFPLLDNKGELKSRFVFVSNIDSKDPVQVIQGNEKVIRPRLADAGFFYNNDKKQTLISRLDSLESVLFQKQLGTLKEKSLRIADLAKVIASMIDANPDNAHRAGLLSKTDLMTDMVMEFPDVQGVMGMHYARNDEEPEEVAIALFEQYKPRFAGDSLPASKVSSCVALADKLDSLVGIFGIGQIPKGDKDPFALRRAAIGVLRIIVENDLDLDLIELVEASRALFDQKLTNPDVTSQVVDFVLARFKTWYQDQGIDVDVIQAVEANRPTRPADFAARVQGVMKFKTLESAKALAAANKRVANILAKNNVVAGIKLDRSLFEAKQEIDLAEHLEIIEVEIQPLLEQGNYSEMLASLAKLRVGIDAFFDNVMVMAEEQAVRENRLALLFKLRKLFLHTADISLLNQ